MPAAALPKILLRFVVIAGFVWTLALSASAQTWLRLRANARAIPPASPASSPASMRRIRPDSNLPASSVSLSAAPNPASLGAPVTLVASIVPSSATGAVTFFDGATILGTAVLTGGTASLLTKQLGSGPHSLAARYWGDGNNATSAVFGTPELVLAGEAGPLGVPVLYPAGNNPQCIIAADFNADGISDLAVANEGDSTVSVLLGTSAGTFQDAAVFATGAAPFGLAAADFNNDGNMDLAVANSGDNTVSVLLGAGNGTFLPAVSYPAGFTPAAVLVGDFNGDGKPDLAVANFSDSTVTILIGFGNGAFASGQSYSTGSGPVGMAAADLNGDGIADLVFADSGDNTVSVLLGRGNGAFGSPVTYPTGVGPSGLAMADLNGDGKLDLAVADYGYSGTLSGDVSVLLGNGNGTLQEPVFYDPGDAPVALEISDVNGDGIADLAVSSGAGLSILLGTANGTFLPPSIYGVSSPDSLVIGDFNGDGVADIAAANYNDSNLAVLLGTMGACTFSVPPAGFVFDANGGSPSLAVTASAPSCSLNLTTDSPWLTVSPPFLLGSGAVIAQAAVNSTGVARTGNVLAANQKIQVIEQATVQQFADVPPTAYYLDAIDLMKSKGITAGCTPGNYCPTDNITRAQMAIFLVRAVYGSDNFSSSPVPYFNDVPPTAFGFPWIQKMSELGFTAGCGGGSYCPNNLVTRDQMAIFIIRARLGASALFDYPPNAYFTDVPFGYFAYPWVQRLKQDGITAGCGTNLYCPANNVSRGDMAIFVMRGAFNQLLAPGTPVIQSINPSAIARGTSATVTVSGVNTTFSQGITQLAAIPGVTVQNVTVMTPNSLTAQFSISGAASPQPFSVLVISGVQEAVLPNGLTIQ